MLAPLPAQEPAVEQPIEAYAVAYSPPACGDRADRTPRLTCRRLDASIGPSPDPQSHACASFLQTRRASLACVWQNSLACGGLGTHAFTAASHSLSCRSPSFCTLSFPYRLFLARTLLASTCRYLPLPAGSNLHLRLRPAPLIPNHAFTHRTLYPPSPSHTCASVGRLRHIPNVRTDRSSQSRLRVLAFHARLFPTHTPFSLLLFHLFRPATAVRTFEPVQIFSSPHIR